jgi:hypothetical protein
MAEQHRGRHSIIRLDRREDTSKLDVWQGSQTRGHLRDIGDISRPRVTERLPNIGMILAKDFPIWSVGNGLSPLLERLKLESKE